MYIYPSSIPFPSFALKQPDFLDSHSYLYFSLYVSVPI